MNVLIVLGGGVYSDGCLPPWITARVEKAYELFNTGDFEYLITSGKGRVHSVLQPEAEVMASSLRMMGMQDDKMYTETLSSSTLENAYFCRTIHVDPLAIHKLTIVTSGFHSERTQKIFELVFGHGYSVKVVASDDTSINEIERQLLQNCDIEQTHFLEAKIFPNIEPGNLKMLHGFIFDSKNELAKLWNEYKQTNDTYRATSKLMSEKVR